MKLVSELQTAKLKAKKIKVDAAVVVVIYRADPEAAQAWAREVVEAAQVRTIRVVEHAKIQFRRETLEEIHARGFDLSIEIESAKKLKAETKKLAYPDDDDSESLSRSESVEDLEDGDAAPEGDQDT